MIGFSNAYVSGGGTDAPPDIGNWQAKKLPFAKWL
jgi:hypothetical protein